MTPAQYQAEMRRLAAKQKQAVEKCNRDVRAHNRKVEAEAARRKANIDKYNREARAHNRKVIADANRGIDTYNRQVQQHNSAVRRNRERRRLELQRLKSVTPRAQPSTRYRDSSTAFQRSFDDLETSGAEDRLRDNLFDLSEGEAANSAAAMNALLADEDAADSGDVGGDELRETSISNELTDIDPDLDARWHGALFALDPRNPDAARHFCTSAREMLTGLLAAAAPDHEVIAANPNYVPTNQGSVSRRARILHCLDATSASDGAFIDFVEQDIDDVVALFDEFNSGTHGTAGRFALAQLRALKIRVEDAIKFVHRIATPRS